MHENEQNQLDSFVEEIELVKNSRILPWWIKAFSWLFFINWRMLSYITYTGLVWITI
jgi:hypothetical protein